MNRLEPLLTPVYSVPVEPLSAPGWPIGTFGGVKDKAGQTTNNPDLEAEHG